MTDFTTHHSETGAASARLSIKPNGRPLVHVAIPTGAGRRLRMEVGPGQARAVAEVLNSVIADLDRQLGAKGRR